MGYNRIMMKETSSKVTGNRKVYNRRGITHICFEGNHFAPNGPTSISKHPVTRVTVLSCTTLEVAQSVNRKKATVEVWTLVTVPRRHKTNTVNGFWKAANAQLTGWTY